MPMLSNTALLLIDLQNDFCDQGALSVDGAEETILIANQAINFFLHYKKPILASQDWHPATHLSFAINSGTVIGEIGELKGIPQVWWPEHCIQNSYGAQFHPLLQKQKISQVIRKGSNIEVDSYSAFFDNGHYIDTGLNAWLQKNSIEQLWIMGLATDYCVKFTVLDALALNYQVWLIKDGCRGVNLHAKDSARALQEMQQQGANLLTLREAIALIETK